MNLKLFMTAILLSGACASDAHPAPGGDIEPDDWTAPEGDKSDGDCGCQGGELDSQELLLGVNREFALSKGFVPITTPVQADYRHRPLRLRPVAAGYFMQLADAAFEETEREIVVGSGYRSFCTQCSLFADYASRFGDDEANTFSARAGHSEHQLGTTLDIFNERGTFLGGTYDIPGTAEEDPNLYFWLDENAWRFGFMNSYPPNEADNGDRFASRTFEYSEYIPEPWHWRFVGREAAKVHHLLATQIGIRFSTHEFVDMLEVIFEAGEGYEGEPEGDGETASDSDHLSIDTDSEELLALREILEELELAREDLEAAHPDDDLAAELALGGGRCHSQTLGRFVEGGECVQVDRADCGSEGCAWWACAGGSWVCAAEGLCPGESFEHGSCEGPEHP